MSCQATLKDSPSVTSSLELEFGPSHFGGRAGQTIDLFGPVPVRANLSARQAKDLGLLMSGTSGLPGTISSESANLSSSLQSKFLMRLGKDGLISSTTTWKQRAMPSGRFVSVLTRQGGGIERQRIYLAAKHLGQRVEGQKPSNDFGSPRPRRWRGKADLLAISRAPFVPGDSWPQPLLRTVADDAPTSMGPLHAIGNAINAEAATQFIAAYLEIDHDSQVIA